MNLADLLGGNPRANKGFAQQSPSGPIAPGVDCGWEKHEHSGTPWRKRPRVQPSQVPASGGTDVKSVERHQFKAHASQYAGALSPEWGKSSSVHGAQTSGSKNNSTEGLATKRRITKATECLAALTSEQRRVLDMVVEDGMSVFFTGAAGSGKSFLLRAIVAALSASGKKDTTFVTGTTGIAACNVGGVTVHSFAGCGLGDEPLGEMVAKMERSSHAKKRWKQGQILVIDEISMLDGAFFEKLACVGARARSDPRPFGGIQLVLCGDFFQLPPVGINQKKGTIFCFEAPAWPTAVPHCVVLSSAFRQSDGEFLRVLNDIRTGFPSEQTLAALRANEERCSRNEVIDAVLNDDDNDHNNHTSGKNSKGSKNTSSGNGSSSRVTDCVATKLYARNTDVDRVNEKELAKLEGHALFFNALDEGDERQLSTLTRNCPAPARLELKVGAQVMLLKNTDVTRGLANGARGVVIGFEEPEAGEGFEGWGALPKVAFKVANSSNNNGGGVGGSSSSIGSWKSGGYRTVTAIIEPAEWSLELGRARVASRMQVPLRCAWAMSIHKSQGMTISQLDVDFSGCFEVGQAYVALSRATSLQGLRLKGLSAKAVRAHPSVVAFYRQLDQDAQQAANQEGDKVEGENEEVAKTQIPNIDRAHNSSSSSGSTSNSSSSSSSSSNSGNSKKSNSRHPTGWAPSRAPLQPWVCPGFNGGANGDGWIQRPHNGKVSAPKTFEEDTWMDQGICVTGRAPQLSESARAAVVASGHHPSASPVVFLPGSRSYSSNSASSFTPGSGTRSSSSSSSSATRLGSMPPAQQRQPSSARGLDAQIGATGGSSWGIAPPHSGAPSTSRSDVTPGKMAPPLSAHANISHSSSKSTTTAPRGDRATATSKQAPQRIVASKSNYSSGAHGILLSSEQQARMESNRNRALALMALKGKRRLY